MDQTQTSVQPINLNKGFLSRPSPHSTVQFLWSSLNCDIVVTGVRISVSERGLRYLWSPVRQMIGPRSVVTGDQQGRTPHPPSLLAPRPGWWNSRPRPVDSGHQLMVTMPHTFNWSDEYEKYRYHLKIPKSKSKISLIICFYFQPLPLMHLSSSSHSFPISTYIPLNSTQEMR